MGAAVSGTSLGQAIFLIFMGLNGKLNKRGDYRTEKEISLEEPLGLAGFGGSLFGIHSLSSPLSLLGANICPSPRTFCKGWFFLVDVCHPRAMAIPT